MHVQKKSVVFWSNMNKFEEKIYHDGDDEELLPTLFEKKRTRTIPQAQRIILIVVGLFLVLAVVFCAVVCTASLKSTTPPVDTPVPDGEVEVWSGAFDTRAAYESAKALTVTLRQGRNKKDACGVGILFGDKGQIITVMTSEISGRERLYAILEDGREYEVESIHRGDGELALLTISAGSLGGVTTASEMPIVGERIFALSRKDGTALVREGTLCSSVSPLIFDISDAVCVGSPLFNSSGELVAVVGGADTDGNIFGISASDCTALLQINAEK